VTGPTDHLEQLELQFEDCLSKASLSQLIDVGKDLGLAQMTTVIRKTVAMKRVRDFAEKKSQEGSAEDTIKLLEHLLSAFKVVFGEEVVDQQKREEDGHGIESEASEFSTGKTGNTGNAFSTTDLAQLLQRCTLSKDTLDDKASVFRRQLKITGIIASTKDNITYLNLLSQIADAKANNYTEDDICRAVRKAIAAASNLRTYFDTQSTMKLQRMLNILRDFYRERTASEMFQDLGRLCQQQQEKATDFIFRAFELRQKVIMAADAEGGLYNSGLVQETFLRAVRTGITDSHIRAHMRPFLDPRSSTPIDDELLLRELNIAAAESEESSAKQKSVSAKKVTIAETTAKTDTATNEVSSAIKPLMEGLANLQKQVNDLQNSNQNSRQSSNQNLNQNSYSNRQTNRNFQKRDRDFRCSKCREQNSSRCAHCFHCGQENHFARDCANKSKNF